MGVYIKNMEMPESCYYCPFGDGVWQKDRRCLINGEEMPRDGRNVQHNHINCPLIEVPKHGRLIDADALPTYQKPIGKLMMYGGEYVYTQTAIDDAPTIIESEE